MAGVVSMGEVFFFWRGGGGGRLFISRLLP